MNIKTFIAAAVVALTAACNQAEEAVVDVPANEAANATTAAEPAAAATDEVAK